jgi:hypothetical protein
MDAASVARSMQPPRRDPLDDSELPTLDLLDLEPLGMEQVERLAQEVIALEPDSERLRCWDASPFTSASGVSVEVRGGIPRSRDRPG